MVSSTNEVNIYSPTTRSQIHLHFLKRYTKNYSFSLYYCIVEDVPPQVEFVEEAVRVPSAIINNGMFSEIVLNTNKLH